LILNTGGAATGLILQYGNLGIGTTAPGRRLDVRGDVIANAYFHHSDRNLKTEIKLLENSLERILGIEGVSFNWKEGGESSIGFIAQDVERKFPELVITDKQTGQKGINYSGFIAALVQAIQEQQRQIEQQQRQIIELRAKIEK
jgi:hypothetical protein